MSKIKRFISEIGKVIQDKWNWFITKVYEKALYTIIVLVFALFIIFPIVGFEETVELVSNKINPLTLAFAVGFIILLFTLLQSNIAKKRSENTKPFWVVLYFLLAFFFWFFSSNSLYNLSATYLLPSKTPTPSTMQPPTPTYVQTESPTSTIPTPIITVTPTEEIPGGLFPNDKCLDVDTWKLFRNDVKLEENSYSENGCWNVTNFGIIPDLLNNKPAIQIIHENTYSTKRVIHLAYRDLPENKNFEYRFGIVVKEIKTSQNNNSEIVVGFGNIRSKLDIAKVIYLGYPMNYLAYNEELDNTNSIIDLGNYKNYTDPIYIGFEIRETKIIISINHVQLYETSLTSFDKEGFWIGFLVPPNGKIDAIITELIE
ncbi:MAG: hypothetical protein PVF83_18300 [Anaerolineales bacterium]|jgi:hypothetical protein